DEAFAYLVALKQILQYGEISDCNLEQGNIRCDVNCSVRPVGQKELGTKTEIKNMNTFKGVHRALTYEIQRQIDTVREGGEIIQETRRWDDAAGITTGMRTKEYAHDYRYFPDPDLMPVVLSEEQLASWKEELPELPAQRKARIIEEYQIPEYDAGVITADKAVADFYEQAARPSPSPKMVSNYIMTEMLRLLSEREIEIGAVKMTPEALSDLVTLQHEDVINSSTAKELFIELFDEGGCPKQLVEERDLGTVKDTGAIDGFVDQVIAENPKSVDDFKGGKKNAIQFLVGQVMRLSKGKAEPKMVAETIKNRLT
ncbi:MAG: Asp-tRNA(Asn)/Glu-tRNA(Gln) amidotransferase subunit GatB, partial [Verrucomicrobiota bacterium]